MKYQRYADTDSFSRDVRDVLPTSSLSVARMADVT